jgi:ribosome-binding protein aMBF1 (putative translation factor)
MPFQKGYDKDDQKRRADRYTPNTQQNKQVEDAMKAARIAVTPENKEKVHRAISGRNLSYSELVKEIKEMFGK